MITSRRWGLVFAISVILGGLYFLTSENSESNGSEVSWVSHLIQRKPRKIIKESVILNQPQWVVDRKWELSQGKVSLLDTFNFTAEKNGSWDGEAEFAWKNFFQGTNNGLILELGAMDGKFASVSKPFEEKGGWKTILIEASSEANKIPLNRPNALGIHMAICEKESVVHFMDSSDGIGGILEFMSPRFLRKFYPGLLKNETPAASELTEQILDWEKVKRERKVLEQPCLPLQFVFDHFNIPRINFMVLDLEGGELSALKSLDFKRIVFDVICVETNRFFDDNDPFITQVSEFLTGKGYGIFQRTLGRNSWFVSKPFFKRIIEKY